jgi:biotin operon repressor
MLDDGVCGSKADLAWAMGVSRAAVTRALARLKSV